MAKKSIFKIEVRSCDGSDTLIKTHICEGIRSAKDQYKRALVIASRFNMYVSVLDNQNQPINI